MHRWHEGMDPTTDHTNIEPTGHGLSILGLAMLQSVVASVLVNTLQLKHDVDIHVSTLGTYNQILVSLWLLRYFRRRAPSLTRGPSHFATDSQPVCLGLQPLLWLGQIKVTGLTLTLEA
jgi:hypothetical protein